jgi:hypothetical protein
VYLRFVVSDVHEESERELGVFHAAENLRRDHRLHTYELDRHNSIVHWFDEHLSRPTRFTASRPPYYRKQNRAISWLKDPAHEHLAHMRELVVILEDHGVSVQTLKTDRVGYIVYEDQFQVVAQPFADTER